MHVDVTLRPESSVALLGRDDPREFIVCVHGHGSLAELRNALTGAAAGVPLGHEAAIATRWIRAQGGSADDGQWEEHIGRLLGAADQRGHADIDGQWIIAPIIWQRDVEPAVA